ncbi:myogenesis-regulating glycosidase-like [Tubulanus polymorphus]|uniref:myogenesis-regulating glycosidase-like n=1 Tax=Tubulanus polymorphus TaxID=672921 RepID=UPI003DA56895
MGRLNFVLLLLICGVYLILIWILLSKFGVAKQRWVQTRSGIAWVTESPVTPDVTIRVEFKRTSYGPILNIPGDEDTIRLSLGQGKVIENNRHRPTIDIICDHFKLVKFIADSISSAYAVCFNGLLNSKGIHRMLAAPSERGYANEPTTGERYWLHSSGIALYASVPVDFDAVHSKIGKQLCFRNNGKQSQYFSVCTGSNARVLHEYMADTYLGWPRIQPWLELFKTAVIFGSKLSNSNSNDTQQKLRYILRHKNESGLRNLIMKTDLKYFVECLSQSKICRQNSDRLRLSSVKMTLPVLAICHVNTDCFRDGFRRGYWQLRNGENRIPYLFNDNDELMPVLNLDVDGADTWFTERVMQTAVDLGTDVFSVDRKIPSDEIESLHRIPAVSIFKTNPRKSQKFAAFVHLPETAPTWASLRALIPAHIHYGLLGYPYTVAPPVGGVDNDLYARWLELMTFLPMMSFTILPSELANEEDKMNEKDKMSIVNISRKYTQIRRNIVEPILLQAVDEVRKNGAPLIRPVWWAHPTDDQAIQQAADDQFMIGKKLLVAPILQPNTTEREIYIPAGRWRDTLKNRLLTGPVRLVNYTIRQDQVATFQLLI